MNIRQIDKAKVGRAVNAWVQAHVAPYDSNRERKTAQDEADATLDTVLVAEGVYGPDDEAYFEVGAAHDHGIVAVFLEDKALNITGQGEIEEFRV